MSLLSVREMFVGYGAGDVLHGVDLDVEPGEIVVVLGANGAGKTTTMKAIAGLVERRGTVEFQGRPLPTNPEQVVRAGISLVPQGRGTLRTLSVLDNLRVGAAKRRDDITEDLERWFDVFPVLRQRQDQRAGTLSGGEQQMLAVARALMSRPTLLLCDEPSLGLAPKIVRSVLDVLAQVNRELGTALVIVEQNAELAMDLADRVFLLEVGTVITHGTPSEIREDSALRRAYLGY